MKSASRIADEKNEAGSNRAGHFPPSNLAGVHRSRLWAQHLPEFGWEPIIVTAHSKYYEEKLDPALLKLSIPNSASFGLKPFL